ncbi:DUF3892 domain-containing protein [Vibrio sp. 3-2(1)]|uniref:DUF3892 domain-containing protein n=1 Tax=Vibrio sp. 3-2(1) TaxID=2591016 RepID=UPI00148340F1|nr:DUF3892 domain-containing protein [Vibrio sp. 3-2(1)]NNN70888.1 DUF3892 domain-containing protein [Vibrio sp. 3-2(1)]
MTKTIVDAKCDSKGNITSVKFAGNLTYTPLETAIRIADNGGIANAHAVHPNSSNPYLRSNPDKNQANNLESMAKK